VTLTFVGEVTFPVGPVSNNAVATDEPRALSDQGPPDGSTYFLLKMKLVNTSHRRQDISGTDSAVFVDDGHGTKLPAAKPYPYAQLSSAHEPLAAEIQALSPGPKKVLAPEQSVKGSLWYAIAPTSPSLRVVYQPSPQEAKLTWYIGG
jgi:hypothetical protein